MSKQETPPLTGRVCLVTGSSAGIGKVVARHLAELGAHVVINGRTEDRASATAQWIRDHGYQATHCAADLLHPEDVALMVKQIVDQAGKLDFAVVSGAGATRITLPWRPFYEMDMERIVAVAYSHWLSKAFVIRAALDTMIPAGYGKIVNISTDAGRVGTSGESMIGGAAAGTMMMTRVIARETGRHGIRLNTIACGPVVDNVPGEVEGYSWREESDEGTILSGTVGEKLSRRRLFPVSMQDLAQTTAFLLETTGDNITGQTWSVNGGLSMVG